MINPTAANVAKTILQQLYTFTDPNVFFSWGITQINCVTYNNDYGLYIYVNGFIYAGGIAIMLDEGNDLYYILIDGKVVKEDIYADMLGAVLDDLIEKPISMTDEEYNKRINEYYNFGK